MTPETEALLAFDVDRALREAVRRPAARPPAFAPPRREKAPEPAPGAQRGRAEVP